MIENDKITLVVASGNKHKIEEFQKILQDLPVTVVSYRDVLKKPLGIVEDGATFEENAKKKALAVGRETLTLTLADDSGLEVDALGGRPGVRSARFAHERATDAENNAALLTALQEVDDESRTARFRCVLVLFDPWMGVNATPIVVEGRCEGRIARQTRGGGGFGYDPLFLMNDYPGKTMAELSDDEKNSVSHRGRAMQQLLPKLKECVRSRLDDVERVSTRRPSCYSMVAPVAEDQEKLFRLV